MIQKEYLFFDLDGTLTDSSEGITKGVMYSLAKFGIQEERMEELLKFIGPPLRDSFMKYYGFSEEEAKKAVIYYREYYQNTGLFENKVYPGMEDVLIALKQAGKKLVVATSKPEEYARRILERFGLYDYFDYIAGAGMDGSRTKKAEVIEYALESCDITDKEEVLMIGDREQDVFGAAQVGIRCMGVLYGFGSRQELELAGAAYIAESVADIERLILK
ncbi:MAG: HAD family hydrolase [Acetivibrio ethanolgignens]